MLPFHANLLQAAIAANAPVQPLALTYLHPASGHISTAPSYAGSDSLFASLWRTVCTPGLVVRITPGQAQHAQGRDRRAWAADLQQHVVALRR